MADIAGWYGVDPYRLTSNQRLGLWMNLDRIRSQHLITFKDLAGVEPNELHGLFLAAFGDKSLADEVRLVALEARIKASTQR